MIVGLQNTNPVRIPVRSVMNIFYLMWYYNGWHYWAFIPGAESLFTEGQKYKTLGTKKIKMSSGQITYSECQAIRTIMNSREVYILTDYGWKSLRIEPSATPVKNNFVNGYEIELSAIVGSRDLSLTGFSPVSIVPVVPPVPDPTQCERIIGTQIWMCKNYESKYPGSKVYADDESNRVHYGGMYTYDQIMSPGFVPADYHVPSLAEWMILINYAGGLAVAANKLKSSGTTYWLTPNASTDDFSFDARGGGSFGIGSGDYHYLQTVGYFWCSDPHSGSPYLVQMNYDSGVVTITQGLAGVYAPVRLIKDISSIRQYYGALYNWYVVNTGLLAPIGFHMPSIVEWQALADYLGASGDYATNSIGGKLKESGIINWESPNAGATNESRLTMLPGGQRNAGGSFNYLQAQSYLWSNVEINPYYGSGCALFHDNEVMECSGNWWFPKNTGASCRPIKNTTSLSNGQFGTAIDIDGNEYATICIGTQEWFASNLKVTKLNNGTPIPEVTDNAAWSALTTGARCWYNNIPE
jgi:uncharacterized protein (TIGR02145 family)